MMGPTIHRKRRLILNTRRKHPSRMPAKVSARRRAKWAPPNFELGEKEYIGFDNLTFKYFNSEDYIFESESFKLPKNSHTVITGPNGSGKSTLLGLLSGVFYANSGKVFSFSFPPTFSVAFSLASSPARKTTV